MEPVVTRYTLRPLLPVLASLAVVVLVARLLFPTWRSALFAVPLGVLVPFVPTLIRMLIANGRTALRIDDEGVAVGPPTNVSVPWDQITSYRIGAGRFYLGVRDPDALGLRRSLWRRVNSPLLDPDQHLKLAVPFRMLDVPPARILDTMRARLGLAGRESRAGG